MKTLLITIAATASIATAATYETCRPEKGSCNMECVSINMPNTVTRLLRECPAKSIPEWAAMTNLDTIPAPVKPDTANFPPLK